jgi:NAD-dependent dihydropyrimidine dehydrogenase PreA subunit
VTPWHERFGFSSEVKSAETYTNTTFPLFRLCYYDEFKSRQVRPKATTESSFMAYVIAEPCIGVKDTACVDACPVDCIHPKKDAEKFEAETMLYIDPVECIDCGACVPVCPVSAIFALDDLPEKWSEYAQKNAAYFGR